MKFEIRNSKFGMLGMLTLLFLGCDEPPILAPGEFTIQAKLSQETLHVGDPVTLTLSARHPAGSTVRFPTPEKRKEVVVRSRAVDTKKRTEEIFETEEIFQITSLRVGDWPLATNPVVCAFADGTEKTKIFPPLILHVQSTLTETNVTKLSDIQSIVKPPLHTGRVIWILLLIAVLALIGGLLTLLLRKQKLRETAGGQPPMPPHIIAHKSLVALRNERWIPEPFFVKLSLILRTYLEARFNLNAPESTTEELSEKLPLEHRQALNPFFTQADLVKFARAGAEQEVMQTAFQTVEAFVTETTQNSDLSDPPDSSSS